jgi:hypothetical protein
MRAKEGRELRRLLKFLRGRVVADQIFEDREDMLAVADDALEDGTKFGLLDGFLVPLRENASGNLDVFSKFFRGMSTKKQAVEKRGFALREIEVLQSVFGSGYRVGARCHVRNRSLQIFVFASRLPGAKKEILKSSAKRVFDVASGKEVAKQPVKRA